MNFNLHEFTTSFNKNINNILQTSIFLDNLYYNGRIIHEMYKYRFIFIIDIYNMFKEFKCNLIIFDSLLFLKNKINNDLQNNSNTIEYKLYMIPFKRKWTPL